MKAILFFSVFIGCIFVSTAQVGINTTSPDPSSILDITSTDKGVLIPRMTQAERNLIGSPVNGLLIYQTDNTSGFYYYNGTVWASLTATGAEEVNDLTDGKTTTTSLFLGENVGATELVGDKKNTGMGFLSMQNNTTGSENTAYGYESLSANTTGRFNVGIGTYALKDNTNGDKNTAVGRYALKDNTEGDGNTAFGEYALGSNLTGDDNTAFGRFAMPVNIIGYGNTSVGNSSLRLNTSYENTAIGSQALFYNTTGHNNTAVGISSFWNNDAGNYNVSIGDRSGYGVEGSRNVFIGYQAGSSNIAPSDPPHNKTNNIMIGYFAGNDQEVNNRLFIENSPAANPLIYGEFDNDIVRINGELQVANPSASGYALPASDGTANQVLTTNGAGQLSFAATGEDADWFKEGTSTAPTAITDDIYTLGNVAIGKNTTNSPLDIEVTGSPTNLIAMKMVDNSTGTGNHVGMQQTLGGTHNEAIKGIDAYISNTGSGLHTGIITSVQNGTGNQVGNQATLRGSTGTNTIFSGTIFNSGAASTAIQKGLDLTVEQPSSQISYGILNYVTAPGANATGIKYGIYNLIDGGITSNHYGVYNDVRGLGSNTKYGTYNRFGIGTANTGGVLYGTYNDFGTSITSTSDKYGNYTIIPSTLAGTHYGSYVDVRNASGYAGYFLGRFSIGTTTGNNYILPASRGTNGQVMTTDGAGNVSFSTLTGESTTANNGLTRTGNNVRLGGTLTQNTTIAQGNNDMIFNLTGTGNFRINDNGINKFVFLNNGDAVLGGALYFRDGDTSGGTDVLGRFISNSGDGALDLYNSGTLSTRINGGGDSYLTGGNLGIGTTTPDNKLSVSGTLNLREDLAGGGVALRVNGTEALWFDGALFSWGYGGTANFFNDDVGIGFNAPAYKLDVRDNVSTNYVAQIYNTNTGTDADGLRIQLGAVTPGNANNFIGFLNNTGAFRGRIHGNGGGVNYATTSDRRLKTNITNFDNALNLIDKIQPRRYEYKTNLGTQEYGFIAQELQPLYPQAVTGSPDSDVKTNPMMVDYSRLTPLLTAGIKELAKKVTVLENENEKLKEQLSKYENLEERLSALENAKGNTNSLQLTSNKK